MNILRASSEEEMIAEFLKAEYSSERFSERIKEIMDELFFDESIILSADINNAAENTARKKLPGEFRGYGLNRELFERFPTEINFRKQTNTADNKSGSRTNLVWCGFRFAYYL